jgi:hypothetical protein
MTTTKIRLAFAALALALAGSANATIIDWGSITAPDHKIFGDSFTSRGDFSDEYRFTLTNGADSFGGVLEIDVASFFSIDIKDVALYFGGSAVDGFTDSSGGLWTFSFDGLVAGAYSLFVNGHVGLDFGGLVPAVGYIGGIDFQRTTAQVAEPGTLALMGAALLGMAFAFRRRLFN